MPVFNARNPLEYLLGAGELGLSGVTNLASMVGSVPYGIYKQMESGEYGQNTDAFDKYSKQMMDAGTYQPRTAAAQDIGSLIGSLMEDAKIPPVMPELMPLAALSANPVARNAQIERAGMAAERAIEPAVIRTLEKGGANAQSLMDMVRGSMSPMDVYHGSPFKFDQFASKAIGSGEGAQAYGYGHYLAESPDVAKQYRTDRSYVGRAMAGKPDNASYGPDWIAQQAADVHGENAISHLQSVLKQRFGSINKSQIEENKKVQQAIDLLSNKQIQRSGNLYKVDLPDDQMAKMLDFDAELGKQTPEVQALAKQYGLNMGDLGGDLVARMNAEGPAGAESMRQSGITGIRYKDAQSRGGQQANTSNFVVFPGNEGLLSILERNEVSIPRGGLLEGKGFEAISSDAADIFGVGAKKVVYKDPYSGGLMQVLTRPGQPASVLGLEVPENFRNQGIAGRLQGQALKDFPNMQGQVSSKAAAKSAYKLGRRPVGKPDASIEEVFKMIDEDSSVNLVSPARQKEISGAYGR